MNATETLYRSLQGREENLDREDLTRVERVTFGLEHPKLRSLSEAVKVCPGFQEECGDEIDSAEELCGTHRRAEARFYQEQIWERDRNER